MTNKRVTTSPGAMAGGEEGGGYVAPLHQTAKYAPEADQIRAALRDGHDEDEIAEELGCPKQNIRAAKRRSATRGRPRVHTHPAEACARFLEDAFNTATTWTEDEQAIVLALAKRVRNGEWRKFLEEPPRRKQR